MKRLIYMIYITKIAGRQSAGVINLELWCNNELQLKLARTLCEGESTYKSHGGRRYAMGT